MSVMSADRLRALVSREGPAGSRALAFGLFALGAVFWLSWPTLVSLHARWIDFGYSHGYLILLLSGWLALKALRREPLAPLAPSFAGAGVLAVAAAIVLIAQASTTVILAQAALPALWFAAVWALLGLRNARRFFLPIAYLYFAIPLWDAMNGSLQSLTVAVVSLWLRAADIPAYIEGNLIHIPAGSFEVAGGCSGLHYLLVGLSLGAYLGLAGHVRWQPRLALFGLALVSGLFANWVRVFTVIVAGHATDMQHFLIVRDHYYYGWALFLLLCLVPLIVLDRRLPVDEARGARADAALPVARERVGAVVAVIVICLAAALLQGRALGDAPDTPYPLAIPAVEGWDAVGEWNDPATPEFAGADATVTQRFTAGEEQVAFFAAYYPRQVQGREVVYYANRPEGEGGRIVAATPATVPGQGMDMPWLEIEAAGPGGATRLLWLGRRIGGRWANSDLAAKSYQVLGAVIGQPDALVIVFSAACDDRCDNARASLARFAGALDPGFFEAGS